MQMMVEPGATVVEDKQEVSRLLKLLLVMTKKSRTRMKWRREYEEDEVR